MTNKEKISLAERKRIAKILRKRKGMISVNAMWVAAEIQEKIFKSFS